MQAPPQDPGERLTGPLRPVELATAAVLGGLSALLIIFSWFVPHTSAVGAASAIPFGVIGHRYRARAVIAACVGASAVAFLMAGTGPLSSVVIAALIGGLVGIGRRRRWGLLRVLCLFGLIGPVLAGISDALLALFAPLRILTLAQIRNSVHGLSTLSGHLPGLAGPSRELDRLVRRALDDWPVTVAVLVIVAVLAAAALAWVMLGQVLQRLAWLRAGDRLSSVPVVEVGPVAPLPVSLHDVTYLYAGSSRPALAGVSISVEPGELVAVTGDNGSGKSTLTRILAGQPPTRGLVRRPGAVGLGRPAGTAMVFQRPESQVLGVRVQDDVVWGLPGGHPVDVGGLLELVGLSGMGARETASLSGGELQRLAVAAALAREPRLLLSDESTAMVDAEGREQLLRLFRRLPEERGVTVVHVTHRAHEAVVADRVVHLRGGRLADPPPLPDRAGVEVTGSPVDAAAGGELLLSGVSHTWAEATPWANTALTDVDVCIPAGSGVAVSGGNGSGKSTLAWIMAGLLPPTLGECLLDGHPVTEQVGAVGLAFQHARLQVQRPTVGADVRAAGGVGRPEADEALRLVGLEPAEMQDRHPDELSGGQLRRVALAGLLARKSRVLILDEPLAGLDGPGGSALLALLRDLRREAGLTLVVISHDLEGMEMACDRMVRLEAGRVIADEALVAVP